MFSIPIGVLTGFVGALIGYKMAPKPFPVVIEHQDPPTIKIKNRTEKPINVHFEPWGGSLLLNPQAEWELKDTGVLEIVEIAPGHLIINASEGDVFENGKSVWESQF